MLFKITNKDVTELSKELAVIPNERILKNFTESQKIFRVELLINFSTFRQIFLNCLSLVSTPSRLFKEPC